MRKALFLLLAWALRAGAALAAGADVTGEYGLRERCPARLDDASGLVYIEHCFSGGLASAWSLQLVQNGKHVCGRYTQCQGRNCAREPGGRVVGIHAGDRLRLWREEADAADGPAPMETYRVGAGALVRSRDQVRLVRRASGLKDAALRDRCRPELPAQPLLKAAELQVPGLPAYGGIDFTETRDLRAPAPATRVLHTSAWHARAQWHDRRAAGSHVLRRVLVRNDTAAGWLVSAAHPALCRAFLVYGERTEHTLRSALAAESPLELAPGDRTELASCNGTRWTFERLLPLKCLGGTQC